MLFRFDPLRDLDRLASTVGGRFLPMDAYREGDAYVVAIDVPGVDPSTIDLSVDRNVLTVRVERPHHAVEHAHVLANERPHGSFTRQLFLGEGLDTERIEASYDHGVLTVRVPVGEAARPRKVEIGSGARKELSAA